MDAADEVVQRGLRKMWQPDDDVLLVSGLGAKMLACVARRAGADDILVAVVGVVAVVVKWLCPFAAPETTEAAGPVISLESRLRLLQHVNRGFDPPTGGHSRNAERKQAHQVD